jgi:CRISPR/Cas system-associated endonuclease Cas1
MSDILHPALPCPFIVTIDRVESRNFRLIAKDGVKKRLWQTIVRRKILNQAASLSVLDRDNAETLTEIARHVEPGDPENVEARAARFYWGRWGFCPR